MVLDMDSSNIKCIYRRGIGLWGVGKLQQA